MHMAFLIEGSTKLSKKNPKNSEYNLFIKHQTCIKTKYTFQDKEKLFVLRVHINKLLKSKFKGKQNW